MDKDANQTADLYFIAAWFETNRKRVITITAIVAAVGAIIGGYFWYQAARETSAAEALSNIPQPATAAEAAMPASAQPYLQIADQYSGTTAAARALLIAGRIQFEAGKFDDARATFEKFMGQYSTTPWANEAQLGVAASLEAGGKLQEATAHYEDIVKRHQADSTTPQAKSALARCYVAEKKPELALQQYQDLVKANNNDTWSAEANIQIEELLAQNPGLRKAAPVPVPAPATSSTVTVPPLK
jgi:predicted negative regulator of RcsB-dependent stress response